jgi:hypothetical protein
MSLICGTAQRVSYLDNIWENSPQPRRLPWGFLVENPLHIDADMRAASTEWTVKKLVSIPPAECATRA